jgi:MFS transporter, AAHS family, 4-hydroxybenzoate transporter
LAFINLLGETVSRVDVADLVDRSKLHPIQIVILVLCWLCMVMDGFDVQAMAYVAPALLKEWKVAKPALGPVFSAGLFGVMVGSLVFSVVADRIGRRPVLIGAMLFLASGVFATANVSSLNAMLAFRLISGLAMGAIIPNAMALSGEFSPLRYRVTLMMIVSSGFIIGGAAGGFVAAALIPIFGWPAVFYAGAVAPLIIAIALIFAMPESMQFQVVRGKNLNSVRKLLARVAPQAGIGPDTEFAVPERPESGMPVANLFRNGLAVGTILLWIINFMNLLCVYFLANWLPVVMNETGHSAQEAVLAGTMMWVGGVVGNLLLGWLVDRRGFGPVLSWTFAVAALAVVTIGHVAGSLTLGFLAIGIAGFCVLGAQSGLNALGPTYYPISVRSTGTGWASGIGRFGSVVGPILGSQLISLQWSTAQLFQAAAVPAALAVVAMVIFWRIAPLGTSNNVSTYREASAAS